MKTHKNKQIVERIYDKMKKLSENTLFLENQRPKAPWFGSGTFIYFLFILCVNKKLFQRINELCYNPFIW